MENKDDKNNTPDFNKPVDVKAFIINEFRLCGCVDLISVCEDLKKVLEYVKALEYVNKKDNNEPMFDAVFKGAVGFYYLVVNELNNLHLCEHGGSLSFPWLIGDGMELLMALTRFSAEEIEYSTGEAYDGCKYVCINPQLKG